jgi:penicillin-binding protein 1A
MPKTFISPRRKAAARKRPLKQPIKRGPISTFVIARWNWFKGLSKPKKFALIGGPILAFLILTPLITYWYYSSVISNPDQLLNYNNTGIVLEDRNGEVFYSYGTASKGERLPLDKISKTTQEALISSEDKNFYNHGGFSVVSILGAMIANVSSGDFTAYGGSTLTQQLAKNTVLYSDQTILRKYQELAIAVAIERQYSKDEILDLYLNSVYYGEGAFGIGSAAKTYFGKSAADLTLAESAMLIGLLPAPTAYSPISGNKTYAKERQATVLSRMVNNGVITQAQADEAKAQELIYAPQDQTNATLAPHYAEMVMAELYNKYGEEEVTRSGYRVRTTLDLNLQKEANKAVAANMPFIERNGGSNAALVAIEPSTGAIRALVGSADYENTEFGKVNMAISPRQPGSSIKPLYYTEAMQRGLISPATILKDQPTNFGNYAPQNADRRFRGDVTVRSALSQSLNIPSIEVMQKLGVGTSVEALQRLGLSTIKSDANYGLPLALGSAEAKLTDMTNAYAAFANGGQQFTQTTVVTIEDKFGKNIFSLKDQQPRRVMGQDASFLISDILDDESARAPIFGGSLNTPGVNAAVKTGTTDEARDAWTIGYSKQIAVGVWVGNNDNTPMANGGASMAGPIWRSTLQAAMKGQKNEPFTAPSGVERLLICRSNGLRAVGGGTDGTYQEYFLRGATPSGTCDVPKPPEDTDKDGVTDDKDRCPDTLAGTKVDENGCPVETAKDSDNDGVKDEDDRCADTPAGTSVDQQGCPTSTATPAPTTPVTPNSQQGAANGRRN